MRIAPMGGTTVKIQISLMIPIVLDAKLIFGRNSRKTQLRGLEVFQRGNGGYQIESAAKIDTTLDEHHPSWMTDVMWLNTLQADAMRKFCEMRTSFLTWLHIQQVLSIRLNRFRFTFKNTMDLNQITGPQIRHLACHSHRANDGIYGNQPIPVWTPYDAVNTWVNNPEAQPSLLAKASVYLNASLRSGWIERLRMQAN
jgi:hypothetical protein